MADVGNFGWMRRHSSDGRYRIFTMKESHELIDM